MTSFNEVSMALWSLASILGLIGLGIFVRGRRKEAREHRRMVDVRVRGLHEPASLHPVIDPQICIGSAVCVAACPEGDVLGLVGGAGRLIHGAACIGHGRCAAECPVGAIRLVFGTTERGVDIPHVTPDFETNRSGVYIAGELGGMGLIRNAVRQGVGAVRHALDNLPSKRSSDAVDVAVIGAGPAGIGAALACIDGGATYRVIEQRSFGGTVAHYPRQKVVMTEPVDVPLVGRIHRAEMSKEQLLELWQRIMTETGLEVTTGVRMLDVRGQDGDFEVVTSDGSFRARKVVVAIGRRGTPRTLDVPGEEAPRVTYHLTDPEQYRGKRMLVVGGGDSALEAACALAEEPGIDVTLIYRGESFFRAKEKNRKRLDELLEARKLDVRLKTDVVRIEPENVVVSQGGTEHGIANDYVIVSIGGAPPTALLEQLGVRIDRWFGSVPEHATASTRVAAHGEVVGVDWLSYLLFAVSLGVVSALAWVGRSYYLLPPPVQEASALHERLRSSGIVGHGIGIVATLVMLTNFAYAARKHLRFLRNLGRTRRWLNVHVIVGLTTPAVIAFHAAFRLSNLVATVTYGALAAVVTSGVIGRFVYGRIAAGEGFERKHLRVATLKRFMQAWRMVHVLLALAMVLTIIAHVGVSWLLGYRWIF